eukprot:UN13898
MQIYVTRNRLDFFVHTLDYREFKSQHVGSFRKKWANIIVIKSSSLVNVSSFTAQQVILPHSHISNFLLLIYPKIKTFVYFLRKTPST